jgi:hypothetical protein
LNGEEAAGVVVVGWQLACVATPSLDPKRERKQLVIW